MPLFLHLRPTLDLPTPKIRMMSFSEEVVAPLRHNINRIELGDFDCA